eukprot:1095135-Pyramimonas_sp.AAC.1
MVVADIQARRPPSDHPLFGSVHASHTLATCQGALYCLVCGALGVDQTRKLSGLRGAPTAKGREALSRLCRGPPPKS